MDAAARFRHDLKTPLNQIIGYSELLLEDAEERGDSAVTSDLRKIRSAAHELLELIHTGLRENPDSARVTSRREANTGGTPDEIRKKIFHGRVLAVDDNRENLDTLTRHLMRHGLDVESREDGDAAWNLMRNEAFDLVLLDVLMPGVDGLSVLMKMKADPRTRDVPVIMISALDELGNVARCIEAGAEDYLPKPFNPTLLEARIGACLEKKALRDAEQGHLKKIEETQKRLDKELAEAAAYVQSILPAPFEVPLRVKWKYRPSGELAGDSFGYHWIDEDHFAVYLLDVCGHGVGACLLSVAAINVLRTHSLAGVDFQKPGEVLGALNAAFPMERQNNLYFTLWYGVYHAPSRTICYASGGHPPALLLEPREKGRYQAKRLSSGGMIIGVMEGLEYREESCPVAPGAKLLVICDGCYEIRNRCGEIGDYAALEAFITSQVTNDNLLEALESRAIETRGAATLDDDFSIVEVCFPQ